MVKTLALESGIFLLKSKFFIIRVLTYFSFLLFPIWIQKTNGLNIGFQMICMALYILFMVSQWFFLGKEIDHRFKIYYRVNSSIDRVIYRIFLGMFFFILIFNLLSFLPSKWIYNGFWIIWAILGLFYSWPTRGKIIKESVTTNFTEFRYLDSFEKTLVSLVIVMFIFSFPELPNLNGSEALKLYINSDNTIHSILWSFLKVAYYPFLKYPDLFRLGWSMHFYMAGLGSFLVLFYALARFFVSRRLSLLGIFAVLSSWAWSKMLDADPGSAIVCTYSLLWVWSTLWVVKSATYRSGLLLGLVSFYGVLLDPRWALLIPLQASLVIYFLKNQNAWFKRQLFRYAGFGLSLSVIAMMTSTSFAVDYFHFDIKNQWSELVTIYSRKGFYSLMWFGILILVFQNLFPHIARKKDLVIEKGPWNQLTISILCLFIPSFLFGLGVFEKFSYLWLFSLFALIPLEVLFQVLTRVRSNRNIIYLIYILICLLDSHFEGRIKIFLRLFS